MRKNVICIMAAAVLLSSCAKEEPGGSEAFDAKTLFPETAAAEFLQYTPVQTYEDGYTKSVVRYDSEPIGKDPIIVELYSPNDIKTADDIYSEFKSKHDLRADSEDITDYDAEAFLAYPSVNIYKDGYMAVVTAGSGSDEIQKQLLIEAGSVVAENLNLSVKNHTAK